MTGCSVEIADDNGMPHKCDTSPTVKVRSRSSVRDRVGSCNIKQPNPKQRQCYPGATSN